jgi:hypothetical protein
LRISYGVAKPQNSRRLENTRFLNADLNLNEKTNNISYHLRNISTGRDWCI